MWSVNMVKSLKFRTSSWHWIILFFPNLDTNVFYKMLSSIHFSLGVLFVSCTVGYIDLYLLWVRLDLKINWHLSKSQYSGWGSCVKGSLLVLSFIFFLIYFSTHRCGELGAESTEMHQAITLPTEMQYLNLLISRFNFSSKL